MFCDSCSAEAKTQFWNLPLPGAIWKRTFSLEVFAFWRWLCVQYAQSQSLLHLADTVKAVKVLLPQHSG
jgi:hypothetical protein